MSDIKTKFTLHTEYNDFNPGVTPLVFKKRIEDTSCFQVLRWLTLFAIGFFFLIPGFLAFKSYQREELFAHSSLLTSGQMTTCDMLTGNKSDSTPYPRYHYTYQVENKTYENAIVPFDVTSCEDYPLGSLLQVRYVSSDPGTSSIVDLRSTENFYGYRGYLVSLLCLWLLIVPIIGPGIYITVRDKRLKSRLQEHHIVLEGEIVSIKGFEFKGSYNVTVRYQFVSPLQKVIKGKTRARRQDLKDAELPPVGTPVAVLYADDRAHMVL